uniref:Uncharacterized protein n=1 Tax=Amphilophus citrinellus TaxID=61819 RepID=A0A3Q0SGG3_AMPCI
MGMSYFCAVPATARSTSYRRTRPQGILHIASGSRASGQPPLTRRKSKVPLDGIERNVVISHSLSHSRRCSVQQGLPSDLKVWSSWESNEGSEPQLTLQEEVFTFSSQPHSPKRGQGQGDQEKMEMGDGQVQSKIGRRYDVQPEDDFLGSESDEVCVLNLTSPRTLDPTLSGQLEGHAGSPNVNLTPPLNTGMQPHSSGRAEHGLLPTRCFSPNGQEQKRSVFEKVNRVLDVDSSISVCRRLLQEVKLDDSKQHKVGTLKPVDSSHCDLDPFSILHTQDDEELRMLASLRREQEEDECKASGLSSSQIHRCNISISSDDTSTWTHISLPTNQGHHYQTEMNPFLQSNPSEDEYLNLLYDPCLNCYFEPKTGKYYELA